jgi:hypothetical protein
MIIEQENLTDEIRVIDESQSNAQFELNGLV